MMDTKPPKLAPPNLSPGDQGRLVPVVKLSREARLSLSPACPSA